MKRHKYVSDLVKITSLKTGFNLNSFSIKIRRIFVEGLIKVLRYFLLSYNIARFSQLSPDVLKLYF